MRGPQPQGHVALHYCAYVTSQKRYISTFARSMDPKPSRVASFDKGTPPAKSHDTSFTWSLDKSKKFCLHVNKSPWSSENLVGCWLRMREHHPKSQVTLQLCCHVENKKTLFPQPQGCRDSKGKSVLPKNKNKNAN